MFLSFKADASRNHLSLAVPMKLLEARLIQGCSVGLLTENEGTVCSSDDTCYPHTQCIKTHCWQMESATKISTSARVLWFNAVIF